MNKRALLGLIASFLIPTVFAASPDIVSSKMMTLELARDIANHALEACRKEGYQVSVVVVDRNGTTQVVFRDVFSTRFAVEMATRKANASIMSGVDSSEFRKNRPDIRPELNHLDGILMVEGGVPIRAGGALVGAVGVSGAPSGTLDEVCAHKAVNAVAERLEFAE